MPSTDDDVTDAYCRRQRSSRWLIVTDDEGNLVPSDCWAGADFRNMDLSGAHLSGADLAGADLSGADLSGADLVGVDLSRADLSGADLTGAYLFGANLGEWERGPDGYARRKEAKK